MPKKSARGKPAKWRSDQESNKAKQKVKLALLVLSLIVFLIIVSQVVKIVTNFYKPITPGLTVGQRQLWDKKYPLNIILRNSSFALVYFDPGSEELSVIDLPDLADSQKGLSPDNLIKVFESKYRIPIDGYMQLSSNYETKTPFEIVEDLKSNPLGWFLDLKSLTSDLTPKELLDLSLSLGKVRFDKVKNFQATDDISEFLKDNRIVNDQATIAVFNATGEPGLAQKAAKMASNLGGNVIIITNAESSNLKNSYVFTKDNAPSYTTERLTHIFTPQCGLGSKCDILEDSDILGSRAQINIVLGQDFIEKY